MDKLRLQVLLSAVDKVTGPLKRIRGGSQVTVQALKAARDQVKALYAQQADVAGYRKQQAAIAGTSQKLVDAQAQLRGMRTALRQTGEAATGKFRTDYRKAHEAVRDLTLKLQNQRRNLAPHATRLREAGIAVGQLGQHEGRLKQQLDAANRSLLQQQERLAAVTRRQQALTKAKQLHDRQQRFVGNMAGAGAAGVAGASAPLYTGARLLTPGLEFEAGVSRVQAITRLERNSPDLKALRDQAREQGGKTKFTAVEVAGAQGFLGMSGFDPKAIHAATPGMLNLATAGDIELPETADIASNILSGMGLHASQMEALGDVMVATITRSNTDLRMLGDTMKYAAPMAKTYGIELETAAAMAGKLGDAGLQGSMGGTALSSIMNRLAAPPKMAAKALEQLNITTADAQGNLRELPDILKEIHDKTAGMGTAVRGGLFKAIAGEEAVKGMAHLVDEAGSGKLQELIATLHLAKGESARTAQVMANNLKGDVTTLKSAWADLGIELEGQQDHALRDLVQSITELIRSTKAWAQENPVLVSGLVKAAAITAGLALAFGTVALTLAALLAPMIVVRLMLARLGIHLPGLIGLFWKLATTVLPFVAKALLMVGRALLLNPVSLVLGLLAGAAYLVYQNWDAVSGFFSSTWAEIRTGFSGGIAGIMQTLANFSPMGLLYRAFSQVMQYLGVELPDHFTTMGGQLMDGLASGITRKLGVVREAISDMGQASIDWFKDKLGIHSPSRVFAELGGHTMQGLSNGLTDGGAGPLQAIADVGKRLAQAGALSLGMASAGTAVAVDNRPPISAAATPVVQVAGDTISIQIQPAPGADPAAIARAVAAELDRRERAKQARARSALSDQE